MAFGIGNVAVERGGVPDEAGCGLLAHGIRILEAGDSRGWSADDAVEIRTLQLGLLIGIDGMAGKAALKDALTARCIALVGVPMASARQQDAERPEEQPAARNAASRTGPRLSSFSKDSG